MSVLQQIALAAEPAPPYSWHAFIASPVTSVRKVIVFNKSGTRGFARSIIKLFVATFLNGSMDRNTVYCQTRFLRHVTWKMRDIVTSNRAEQPRVTMAKKPLNGVQAAEEH